MSPTPIGRSRGHRSVGVGDSDLGVQLQVVEEFRWMVDDGLSPLCH
ncbi:MAG: hypothetical protein K2H04_05510 [Bacteroidaceae bacterium]|nr:hypothetical protein [Bacteroidaceae bacterium]